MESHFLYVASYYIKESHNVKETSLNHYKKIGVTEDIEKRMVKLIEGGTKAPIKCQVLSAWQGPKEICVQLENDLHNCFQHYKVNGEWFCDDDESMIPFITREINKAIKKHNISVKKLF